MNTLGCFSCFSIFIYFKMENKLLPPPLVLRRHKSQTMQRGRKERFREIESRVMIKREREDECWQVVTWLGTLINKRWTCSQIYKAFLGTCVCSIYGKTIQSDDHKSPAIFFFFSLFVFELCNLLHCHSSLQLIQGGCAVFITTACIVQIFGSLDCLSRTSVQHSCRNPPCRYLWKSGSELTFANGVDFNPHFYFYVRLFFFFLPPDVISSPWQLYQTFMKIIDKQQKCQMR